MNFRARTETMDRQDRKNEHTSPFMGLRKALRARKHRQSLMKADTVTRAASPSSPPLRPPHLDDHEAFLEAMGGVREIPAFREMPLPPPSPRPALPGKASPSCEPDGCAIEELRGIVDGNRPITLRDTDEYMEWARPGLTRSRARQLLRSLHGGAFAIGDFLDLHGLTEDEAWHEVEGFLSDARKRGLSCVKIIHGRGLCSPGEPVLKGAVARWLSIPLSKYVLAFATAEPRDGGLGATYVLLSR